MAWLQATQLHQLKTLPEKYNGQAVVGIFSSALEKTDGSGQHGPTILAYSYLDYRASTRVRKQGLGTSESLSDQMMAQVRDGRHRQFGSLT